MSTGSAQQTQTTTAGLSPWSQPYVGSMLGAAQQQVFNMDPTTGQATGIKPYAAFGAPMDAQGNVVPYGGQAQGMGWGAYGGQQQNPPGTNLFQLGMGAMPGAGGGPSSMVYTPEQAQQDAYLQSLNPNVRQQREAQMRSMERQLQGQRQYSAPQLGGTAPGQEQPDFGFTRDPDAIGGMALTQYRNEKTGQTFMAPDTATQPPNADWKRVEGPVFSGGDTTQGQQGAAQPAYDVSTGGAWGETYTPALQQPRTGYPTGTMQAGMGPGEQLAARAAVAGPSGLQQQAYGTAAGMQVPGQYGTATDIGQAAAYGLLGTAGQAQGLQSLAQQAIQQGRQYGQDITDPYRTQAFMSPYMQNVVAAQQREAQRLSDIAGTQQAGQAVKSGAFGGSRAGLLEAERQRNLATQLGDIQAQGLQAAFTNAQQQQLAAQNQAMQGYNTGIQGYGAGITGQTGAYGQAAQTAAGLGALGGQQLGAQQSITNLQNTLGQQQQQNQQNIINQAMQNYNMQRMYPQQQLQYLSSLLSGLPVSSTGSVTNIPAPSMLSQLGGLGLAGAGAYGLYNKIMGQKKGGKVESRGGNGLMDVALSKIGA